MSGCQSRLRRVFANFDDTVIVTEHHNRSFTLTRCDRQAQIEQNFYGATNPQAFRYFYAFFYVFVFHSPFYAFVFYFFC